MKTPYWNELIKTLSRYNVGNIINQKNLCRRIKARFNDTSFAIILKYLFYLEFIRLVKKDGPKNYQIVEKVPERLNLEQIREFIVKYPHRQDNSIHCLLRYFESVEELEKIKNMRKK